MISIVFIMLATTMDYSAQLRSCYDADTCRFDLHLGMNVILKDQQVRLCDINAPEIRSKNPIEKENAYKARMWLLGKLNDSKSIIIRVPQKNKCTPPWGVSCDKHGKYGRLLAWIIADDINLNEELVKQKLAVPYSIKCTK